MLPLNIMMLNFIYDNQFNVGKFHCKIVQGIHISFSPNIHAYIQLLICRFTEETSSFHIIYRNVKLEYGNNIQLACFCNIIRSERCVIYLVFNI